MKGDASTLIRRGLQREPHLKPRVRSFFLYVVLPSWLLPGLLDWMFHRRSRIERPGHGGATESLIHSTMFVEAGLPILLSATFEMNPLVIVLMTAAAGLHEITAIADVRLALDSEREVSQWEQHVHSVLEVMPFWMVPLMVLLHEPMTKRWGLTRRTSVLSRRDHAIVAAAIGAASLPYAEELLRCLKHRRIGEHLARSETDPLSPPARRGQDADAKGPSVPHATADGPCE